VKGPIKLSADIRIERIEELPEEEPAIHPRTQQNFA
jgi:hypothetical protein